MTPSQAGQAGVRGPVTSRTVYAALVAGAVGAILGLIIGVALPPLPLFGDWAAVGSIIAMAAGVVAAITAGIGYWQVRDRAGDKLSALTVTMHMASIIIAYAFLAALAAVALFWVLSHAFVGLVVPPFWSAVSAAAVLGLTVYLVYPSVTRITTQRLSSLLLAFVAIGALASMVTATDPAWWKMHFSYLGSFATVSGLLFNGTLIVGGVLVSTFGFHLANDISLLVADGIFSAKTVRFVRTCFVIMGIMLAGVGLVPFDVNVAIHNACAMGMLVVFLTLLIGGHRHLRDMPRAYFIACWGFVASIALTVVLFAVGFFNVTAVEIVAFSLIFGWISVFVRFLGEAGSAQPPRASSHPEAISGPHPGI